VPVGSASSLDRSSTGTRLPLAAANAIGSAVGLCRPGADQNAAVRVHRDEGAVAAAHDEAGHRHRRPLARRERRHRQPDAKRTAAEQQRAGHAEARALAGHVDAAIGHGRGLRLHDRAGHQIQHRRHRAAGQVAAFADRERADVRRAGQRQRPCHSKRRGIARPCHDEEGIGAAGDADEVVDARCYRSRRLAGSHILPVGGHVPGAGACRRPDIIIWRRGSRAGSAGADHGRRHGDVGAARAIGGGQEHVAGVVAGEMQRIRRLAAIGQGENACGSAGAGVGSGADRAAEHVDGVAGRKAGDGAGGRIELGGDGQGGEPACEIDRLAAAGLAIEQQRGAGIDGQRAGA
jgi:hypothetical protein